MLFIALLTVNAFQTDRRVEGVRGHVKLERKYVHKSRYTQNIRNLGQPRNAANIQDHTRKQTSGVNTAIALAGVKRVERPDIDSSKI